MRICPQCRTSFDGKERYCTRDATPLVEKGDFLRIGGTVGNYRLLSIIGRGGMGTVFKGEHVYIGKPVAVKILHERFAKYEEAVQRFLREARAASSIQHPNIVDVTDFGPTPDGGVYFVMEYLEGQSLEDVIEREAPVALHRAINIVNQICSALAAAHEKGIVHRDLKPENVMLTKRPGRRELIRAAGTEASGSQKFSVEREGMFDFVKVLDFGIAKVNDPDAEYEKGQTVAGTIFGTPEYMSPEAAKGQLVDRRADIYSLGVIFYDMLTGRVPFEGPTPVEVLTKHINEPPEPPRQRRPDAEITEAAERLILKALSKNPDDRFQSMDDLRNELQSCYGTVAYRRDAFRVPGARESGMVPRLRRLTEELDEWLRANRGALDEATRRIRESTPLPPNEDVGDWDELDDDGGGDAPVLLTKKKR